MKKKMYIAIMLIVLITFFSGITYSFFHTNAIMNSSNQGIASFVFEANSVDEIDLELNDLMPGTKKEYFFSVANTKNEVISDVTVEYQLIIKTYHFIPLTINLYKIEEEKENFVGKCDETISRNSLNELVCNMPSEILDNSIEQKHDYKLKIEFPEKYNDISYSNLVDFINIEIESWQKIQEVENEEE